MTVCIAALCKLNYAKNGTPEDWGTVAITASDRMITFGDVQYEPNQTKAGRMTKKTSVLISGDYSLHSEALKKTVTELERNPSAAPYDVALIYGRAIQAIKRRHAEDLYLAPLGLNTDMLNASDMSDSLVSALVNQMQAYQGEEVEALVVGVDKGNATIYHIDTRGTVTCADDVGFATIGSGAWHARSQLMQTGYTNAFYYFPAMAAVYAAKKTADVSPGVGSTTDIQIFFRDGPENLLKETKAKLIELYDGYMRQRGELAQAAVQSLIDFVIEQDRIKNAQGKEQSGGDAQANASASPDAAEAPQGNEAGEAKAETEKG